MVGRSPELFIVLRHPCTRSTTAMLRRQEHRHVGCTKSRKRCPRRAYYGRKRSPSLFWVVSVGTAQAQTKRSVAIAAEELSRSTERLRASSLLQSSRSSRCPTCPPKASLLVKRPRRCSGRFEVRLMKRRPASVAQPLPEEWRRPARPLDYARGAGNVSGSP